MTFNKAVMVIIFKHGARMSVLHKKHRLIIAKTKTHYNATWDLVGH